MASPHGRAIDGWLICLVGFFCCRESRWRVVLSLAVLVLSGATVYWVVVFQTFFAPVHCGYKYNKHHWPILVFGCHRRGKWPRLTLLDAPIPTMLKAWLCLIHENDDNDRYLSFYSLTFPKLSQISSDFETVYMGFLLSFLNWLLQISNNLLKTGFPQLRFEFM